MHVSSYSVTGKKAWSVKQVQVLNWSGVSGEGVQEDSRQTGSGQVQRPKTEGRSDYQER